MNRTIVIAIVAVVLAVGLWFGGQALWKVLVAMHHRDRDAARISAVETCRPMPARFDGPRDPAPRSDSDMDRCRA